MKRATIVQAAVVIELVILTLILLTGGGADRQEQPRPANTYRPATEQERQEYELEREMDRIWPDWQPAAPGQ